MSNEELREFFNVQFKAIDEKIESNHSHTSDLLSRIEAQTIRTNGRVNKLEDKITEYDKDLSEVRMIKKYPRLAVLILLITMISVGATAGFGVYEFHKIVKEVKNDKGVGVVGR